MSKTKPQTAAAKPQHESSFMAWLKKVPSGMSSENDEQTAVLTVTMSQHDWIQLAQIASMHGHTMDEAAGKLLSDGVWVCLEKSYKYGTERILEHEQKLGVS